MHLAGREPDDDFLDDALSEIGIEESTLVAAEAGFAAGTKQATGASLQDCLVVALHESRQRTRSPEAVRVSVLAAALALAKTKPAHSAAKASSAFCCALVGCGKEKIVTSCDRIQSVSFG